MFAKSIPRFMLEIFKLGNPKKNLTIYSLRFFIDSCSGWNIILFGLGYVAFFLRVFSVWWINKRIVWIFFGLKRFLEDVENRCRPIKWCKIFCDFS